MTREEAYVIGNIIHQEVIAFYESQFDGIFKKCNIYPKYHSFRGNTSIRSKLINEIFDDHEAELKAKDEEIETLKTEFRRMQDIAIKKDGELCKALEQIEELKDNHE